jgi:hypothetical protein
VTKRLIPYAGAERRPAGNRRSVPARSTLAAVDDRFIALLMGEITRAVGEIKQLQEEIDAFERILHKVRQERRAIT